VLVTAAPVDRRRSFPKWCEKNADFLLADGGEDAAPWPASSSPRPARSRRVRPGPWTCCSPGSPNARLWLRSPQAADSANGAVIEESAVAELTRTRPRRLLRDGRRLLQRRPAVDAGGPQAAFLRRRRLKARPRGPPEPQPDFDPGPGPDRRRRARVGPRGSTASARRPDPCAEIRRGRREKSSYNLFTQNPWYVASSPAPPPAPPAAPDRQPAGVRRRVRGDHPQAERAGGGAPRHGRALPRGLRRDRRFSGRVQGAGSLLGAP